MSGVGDFSVREAGVPDASTLATFREAMFREHGRVASSGAHREFIERSSEAFVAAITAGSCYAWLACADTDPIGSIALLMHPRLPSPESPVMLEGYLLSAYTLPPWRKRGVAAALVMASVAKARALGLGRIRLHATIDGVPVYAKAGFRERHDEMELQLT